MLAIFTNSFDATTDLIIKFFDKRIDIFRFNSDLLCDYSITWRPGQWEIKNLVTLEVLNSRNILTAYWRKPLEMLSAEIPGFPESYYCHEIRYAFREIINSIARKRLFRLVEPFAERRVGKFYQLEAARKYFDIPDTLFGLNLSKELLATHFMREIGVVTKSLSGAEVSDKHVMYTTRIELGELDTEKPWLLQALSKADYDVTCAFVLGKCFWARRSRSSMGHSLDVREAQSADNDWEDCSATKQQEMKVIGLMRDLGLDFGRLDFLACKGELIFLEVNPNGQFAWIDIDNRRGLISSVADAVKP